MTHVPNDKILYEQRKSMGYSQNPPFPVGHIISSFVILFIFCLLLFHLYLRSENTHSENLEGMAIG